MQESRITIWRGGSGEYSEKRSRFIGSAVYAGSLEEAEDFLMRERKKYYDANHHASAFIIAGETPDQTVVRSSDDGEPQGTAGHPMLDVLHGRNIVNAAAVVTRYFGGTLLGTGGLVRAYSKALAAALDSCVLIERKYGCPVTCTVDYGLSGRIDHFFAENGIPVLNREYAGKVTAEILIPEKETGRVIREITDLTGGRAEISGGNRKMEYALREGRILTGKDLTETGTFS